MKSAANRLTRDDTTVTEGSGNVFADIGVADPELAAAKAQLALQIHKAIRAKGWTQTRAAAVMGIDQPKLSAIVHGKLSSFTVDRLIKYLAALGQSTRLSFAPVNGGRREPSTQRARRKLS